MLIYLQAIDSPEDESKFILFYDEYRKQMGAVAFKILKHKEDSEDVVHQVFLKIADNMHMIDEPISSRTQSLLLTMTHNMAVDVIRKKKRFEMIPYDDELAGLPVEDENFDELSAAIAQLPERQRTLISYKYHQGLTNKEIAKVMGLSLSNVIKLDQRVKAKLSAMLREERSL